MAKLEKARYFYEFGPYRIDRDRRQLLRENQPVTLQRKTFDILFVLVENSGQVVSKSDLLGAVWPDAFVEESNLSQHIFVLRKTLGDGIEEKRYIVTVPGRGYRFAEKVTMVGLGEVAISQGAREPTGQQDTLVVASHTRSRILVEEQGPLAKALPASGRSWVKAVLGALCVVLLGTVGYLIRARPKHHLIEQDTVVLANFTNRTGDEVFDDTLKTALGIALDQSPFLNTLSDNRARRTLQLMDRPADTKITSDIAREICQRAGGQAYIAGSIVELGAQYVLTLEALNCQSGDTMVRVQVSAAGKEKVLDALGSGATKLRSALGESLATVQKFDVNLPQATTPSLEALKAYSLGEKVLYQGDPTSAQPYFEHALELDPNFAMAYVELGNTYFTLNELGRAREHFAKAFSLREHTSELEKLHIAAEYYAYGTGELDKALEAMLEDIEYKHGSVYLGLAQVYSRLGQYDKAAEASRTLLARDPESTFGFVNLASDELASQNFSDAQRIAQQAQARGFDSYLLHVHFYTLAFLQRDLDGMAKQQRWFAGQRMFENTGLALAADTEACTGHVKKARELTQLAVAVAERADNKENAAMYQANEALQQAAYGNAIEAQQSAADALKLDPGQSGVVVQAALAFAMAGETRRAALLVQDLNKRFPLDTQMQLLGVPSIEAQLQLSRRQPDLALNTLRAGIPIELANTPFTSNNISCLYPTYIRGQAYLAAGQGAAAAGEFQKIIDHSGVVGNCWTGVLAHLGVARANALQARTSQGGDGDVSRVRALAGYRDFLALWEDADPNIPVLKQAQTEYGKLQ